MSKTIAILVHERTTREMMRRYFIWQLVACWVRNGLAVRSVHRNTPLKPADLLIVHVDLSVVPDAYLDIARQYPVAINSGVRDIRKRSFSRLLVTPDSDWEGPVIVKTNLNSAGLPERNLGCSLGEDDPGGVVGPTGYAVYPNRSRVPRHLLGRRGIVLEKFLPERRNGSNCIRSYNFLGDAEVTFMAYSKHSIIKLENISSMEVIETDPGIREIRQKMGFDYGKFDYVVHDGEVILLDANKTPGHLEITSPDLQQIVERRAEGVYSFLGP